jgi:hypothetical protein
MSAFICQSDERVLYAIRYTIKKTTQSRLRVIKRPLELRARHRLVL